MVLSRLFPTFRYLTARNGSKSIEMFTRTATTTKTGAVRPVPHSTTFGVIRVILVVIPGLLIGAGISKNIASFLEENDLFVPSDDDDDDD